LKQVLDNFILNSVKFTEKGYIKLSINLEENTGMVIFAVEDTGIGVPEDKQDKIFESFEQSDSFTQGLGLGLTICKLIAERIGGTISLDTNYKNGARFVFTHPIK
jgi:signal transduction histidine kinase